MIAVGIVAAVFAAATVRAVVRTRQIDRAAAENAAARAARRRADATAGSDYDEWPELRTYRVSETHVYEVEALDADAAADVVVWSGPDPVERTVRIDAVS